MRLSSFNVLTGIYDYFEAPDSVAINDDHPKPRFSQKFPLGVPAMQAGRPLPPEAVHVGSGSVAMGSIVGNGIQGETSSGPSPDGLGFFSSDTNEILYATLVLTGFFFAGLLLRRNWDGE